MEAEVEVEAEAYADPEAYQLAIEFLYRVELFDRSLPHELKYDVAWVKPAFKKMSSDYSDKLIAQVKNVGKRRKIDEDEYLHHRSRALRYPFAQLEKEYKAYNGRYLLGGIKKWK